MVSFIIAYREADIYRRKNLDFLVRYISKFDFEKEIIVIENDIEEKYFNSDISKIFIKSDGEFNKSACYNLGAKKAKYDILFFNDIDIIMKYKSYYDAISEISDDVDVVDPYRKIYYYSERLTKEIIKNNNGNVIQGYDKTALSGVISGGCFCIKKYLVYALKGFDENCSGYGYEDNIFDIKMIKMGLKIKHKWENYSIHLYHPKYFTLKFENYLIYLIYLKIERADLIKKITNTKW